MADNTRNAICGLFCEACSLYIGTHEDPARLTLFAERYGLPVDEIKCDGCRSGRVGPYCRTCFMKTCAAEKGVEFCGSCADYPCEQLKAFQAERPHRIELFADLDRIREAGAEAWAEEKRAEYSCPQCGVINSAYDFACRSCGAQPSNEYVRKHRAQTEQMMQAMPKPPK